MKQLFVSTLALLLAACSGAGTVTNPGDDPGDGGKPRRPPEPAPSWSQLPAMTQPDRELVKLPSREEQYAALCAVKHNDSFYNTLCGQFRPKISDLASLLELIGLDRDRAFALTGNSTSLVAMNVSALNPRIIVFPRVDSTLQRRDELIALGFVRGEQFVEIVSRDLTTGEPNFYLLSFEQACNYDAQGCDLAALLTEEIEHDWTAYSVYSADDLEKTSLDCRACHQPGGYGTKQILRMQELESPWTHWFPQKFQRRTDSDRVLTGQFLDGHSEENQYGGIPIGTIANGIDEGSGAQLEALLQSEGHQNQPNVFDPRIEAEAKTNKSSALWQAQWEVGARGDSIAVPYPLIDITDATKRAAATKAYRDVVTHAAPRSTLVDIRNIISNDAMEKLNFVPQPSADGKAILLQMCSRCHDGRANPAVNRSKFNVKKLDEMSRGEKDLAILRLGERDSSPLKMPPWRGARMTDAAIQAAKAELSK